VNGHLLDSNIPSEFSRDRPELRVIRWLKRQPRTTLFPGVVTIGEIRKGLVVMPAGRRPTELEEWFHTELLIRFRNRILPITQAITDRWGLLEWKCQLRGVTHNTATA
jgi:predicted nucleic acid-binding protein